MKKVVLLIACLTGCNYSNIAINFTPTIVEEYKQYTVNLIAQHLERHPDCELKHIKLEDKIFLFADIEDKNVKAYVIYPKRIVFNNLIKWSKWMFAINTIHELTHLDKQDNKYICGNDSLLMVSSINKIPVCRLFGENQYYSHEITKAIDKHLRES